METHDVDPSARRKNDSAAGSSGKVKSERGTRNGRRRRGRKVADEARLETREPNIIGPSRSPVSTCGRFLQRHESGRVYYRNDALTRSMAGCFRFLPVLQPASLITPVGASIPSLPSPNSHLLGNWQGPIFCCSNNRANRPSEVFFPTAHHTLATDLHCSSSVNFGGSNVPEPSQNRDPNWEN
jgi:hypothetical protein